VHAARHGAVAVGVNPVEPVVLDLSAALRAHGWSLATAESCTGGLMAAACTALAGSSQWFDRGFVTYSNAAKTEQLGVPADCIAAHGEVSREVVCAMATGALAHSSAQLAVAVTGIAGPTGATAQRPLGTVWLGVAQRHGGVHAEHWVFCGDRAAVREQAVLKGFELLLRNFF
jgi:nicotinamide-nucleotide amidase